MAIRCGRGNHYHESVHDVFLCYNGDAVNSTPETRPASDRITQKQLTFLNKLRTERGLTALPDDINISKREASAAIDDHRNTSVQKSSAPSTATSNIPDVPAGHYAVKSLTGNQDLDFFRVDRPTEGHWVGRTYVKRVIGGKPDSKVWGATALAALEAIVAVGPEKAGILYGQEIGRCCRCNRHLTDQTSRQAGMGPECRSRAA